MDGYPALINTSSKIATLDYSPVQETFRDALLKGLEQEKKAIPARFLYDEEGSRIFDKICQLPEYYSTRTECGILRDKNIEIANVIGPRAALIDFGAGSSQKASLVLKALDRPVAYVPIDVSRIHLFTLSDEIARDHPDLEVAALCADYTQPLELPPFQARRVGFFPGNSIGNLTRDEARDFLALWSPQLSSDGAMIVGVDMKKAESIILPAYNDASGTTAAFSLNVLHRANREVGADFKVEHFAHHVTYDAASGRLAIHLESKKEQEVTIGDRKFRFDEGELVHVEDSYKYSIEEFQALAQEAGYIPDAAWTDSKKLYSVHVLRVPSRN